MPELIRICKFLARAGICSRREAEKLILTGEITVNSQIIDSPTVKVSLEDKVEYLGNKITIPEREIWVYHKPKGYITTKKDTHDRQTIYDNLPPYFKNFLTVGRLDLNTEGLLILTNDGEYKRYLELPKNHINRTYKVRLFGKFTNEHKKLIENGIKIEDTFYKPATVKIIKISTNSWLEMTLTEGKNREIRKILEHLGYQVNRLIRISYGKYQLGDLKIGETKKITAT